MKSSGFACLLVASLLWLPGCANLKYGWSQERELLDRVAESIDHASRNEISPYWESYQHGWNAEKDHFPALGESLKRGYLADKKRIFNE